MALGYIVAFVRKAATLLTSRKTGRRPSGWRDPRAGVTRCCGGAHAGLTEQEVAEGEAAKKALEEEAGQADGDGSDDENFKKANQFGIHMSKKTDAVRSLNIVYRHSPAN